VKTLTVLLFLGILFFQLPALATPTECPSDIMEVSSCSASVVFNITTSGFTTTVNTLQQTIAQGQNDYLVAVFNNTGATLFGVIFSWDPTVGSSQPNQSCDGNFFGDAFTAGVCDPIETVYFIPGLLPGETQGFAVKFLPFDNDFCADAGFCVPLDEQPGFSQATILNDIANVSSAIPILEPAVDGQPGFGSVPEPGSMALLASGLGALVWKVQRKRRFQ